jgi:diacylglycerol O-acyltransferase / wax synthase
MAAVLHTDEPDSVARIGKIAASMRDQKILQAALPVHAQLEMMTHVPAAAMEQAMRLVFGTRLSERMIPFNLTISNVPGPQMPLYLDGAEQLASYPYSTITDGMALNITVTSYNGHLDWGVVVDRDIVDDAWSMYDGLVAAQAELLERATPGRAAASTRRPSATSRPSTARTKRLRAVAS